MWKTINNREKIKEEVQNLLPLLEVVEPNFSQKASDILKSCDLAITAEILTEELQELSIETLLELPRRLLGTKLPKQLLKLLQKCPLTREHSGTITFLTQFLLVAEDAKMKESIIAKLEEIYLKENIHAILSVNKGEISSEVLSLLEPPCAITLFSKIEKLLKHEDHEVRKAAIKSLGNMSWQTEHMTSSFSQMLLDAKSEVCKEAANALVKMDKLAVDPLIDILANGDVRTQILASWSLGKIADSRAIPQLLKSLQIEDEKLNNSICWALGNIGEKAHGKILLMLPIVKPGVQVSLINVLAESSNTDPKIISALISLLENENKRVVLASVDALGNKKIHADVAVEKLLELLEKADIPLQIALVRALGKIGHQVELAKFFPKITDPLLKKELAIALGKVGDASTRAIRLLISLLEEEDVELKLIAIDALTRFGDKASHAINALMPLLKSEDKRIKEKTIAALANMEMYADKIVPILVRICRKEPDLLQIITYALVELAENHIQELMVLLNENIATRKAITGILVEFGEKSIPYLKEALHGKKSNPRKAAGEALAKIGDAGIPTLVEALKMDDFWIKTTVTSILTKCNGGVGKHLIEPLSSSDEYWRSVAVAILKKIYVQELPHFILMLQEKNPQEVQFAAQMIKSVTEKHRAVVPELLPLLKHPNNIIRQSTSWCLGKIGYNAPEVIEALMETLDDSDPAVKKISHEVLTLWGAVNSKQNF